MSQPSPPAVVLVAGAAGQDGQDGDPHQHDRGDQGCAKGDPHKVGSSLLHALHCWLRPQPPGLAGQHCSEVAGQNVQHIALVRHLQGRDWEPGSMAGMSTGLQV